MLTNLYIENIAVIEKSNIDFTNGLNVLTGETGAGKSIVIDAINAVLGKRSSRGMIRTGADAAYVSATFEELSELVHKKLGAMGYSAEDGSLILSRELSVSGKNGSQVELSNFATPALPYPAQPFNVTLPFLKYPHLPLLLLEAIVALSKSELRNRLG